MCGTDLVTRGHLVATGIPHTLIDYGDGSDWVNCTGKRAGRVFGGRHALLRRAIQGGDSHTPGSAGQSIPEANAHHRCAVPGSVRAHFTVAGNRPDHDECRASRRRMLPTPLTLSPAAVPRHLCRIKGDHRGAQTHPHHELRSRDGISSPSLDSPVSLTTPSAWGFKLLVKLRSHGNSCACGANAASTTGRVTASEPSPRARDRLRLAGDDGRPARTIPACAGPTRPKSGAATPGRDHPRVRGADWDGVEAADPYRGPSPRARGRHPDRRDRTGDLRTIPACAGPT